MRELLNLPGPWFLAAYVGLGLIALLLRPAMRRLCPASRVASNPGHTELSTQEMAYLAGGERRLCETAAVSLAQHGAVAADPTGRGLVTTGPRPARASEVERAVFDSLHGGGGAVPTHAAGQTALRRCAEALSARGLLHAPGSSHLRCMRYAANAPLFALTALGLAKIALGIQRDRPVSLLVLLVLGTVAIMWFARGPAAARTPLGHKTLEVLNRRNAALRTTVLKRSADVSDADRSVAVALFGLSVLSGSPLAWLAQALAPPPAPATSSSSDSDGGSGSSSSSSCGSSSSSCGGGSGCGGCGS